MQDRVSALQTNRLALRLATLSEQLHKIDKNSELATSTTPYMQLLLSSSEFASHYLLNIYPTLPESLQFLLELHRLDSNFNGLIPSFNNQQNLEPRLEQSIERLNIDYKKELSPLLNKIEDENALAVLLRHFRQQKVIELIAYQLLPMLSEHDHQQSFRQNVEQNTDFILLQLSRLADAIIALANDWLYQRCISEMGVPQDSNGNAQPLVIIAMGKLGGNELNFSSDVDLIFAYPESGSTFISDSSVDDAHFHHDVDIKNSAVNQISQSPKLKSKDNSVFFLRLAQRLIKLLDQMTADGFVYRVDMRLRPLGDSGPLVTTYSALEDYYQEQGRDWERYALIKARVISHCEEQFKIELNRLLKPFVYRRYIDFSVLNAIRSMKLMIQREVLRKSNVLDIKLSAGGIREIEFTVQAIQLIYGGRIPALRTSSLKVALNEIETHNLLPKEQIDLLHQNYLFLRRCENILQSIKDEQTQLLPSDDNELLRLAYLMGFSHAEDFMTILTKTMADVRDIFNQVIRDEGATEQFHSQSLLPVSTESSQVEKRELHTISYQDAELFWAHLLQNDEVELLLPLLNTIAQDLNQKAQLIQKLREFVLDLSKRTVGPRGRIAFDKLIPTIIVLIIENHEPLFVLERLLLILMRLASRTIYLELLIENPIALDQLIRLCRASSLIAERLAKYPMLLGELLDAKSLYQPIDIKEYASELIQYMLRVSEDDDEVWLDSLCQFKQIQQLRIAASDITGKLTIMQVSDHLTALAEVIIHAVTEKAWRTLTKKYGFPQHLVPKDSSEASEKGFLVIAYGKLGGWELGYRSDLDLVFLMDNPTGSYTNGERVIDSGLFYLRLAQRVIHLLSARTNSGLLYDVDTRLRPEGNSGLLVSDLKTFLNYQNERAWTWEHQALVRARAVYGEASLRSQYDAIRYSILTQKRELTTLRRSIVDMRHKMVSSKTESPKDEFIESVLSQPDQQKKEISESFNLKDDIGGITDIEFLAQYIVLAFAHKDDRLTIWQDTVRILDCAEVMNLLSSGSVQALKQIYTEMRNSIHQLSLQKRPPEVIRQNFVKEIDQITDIWYQMILKPD